jgi:serine protease AprX
MRQAQLRPFEGKANALWGSGSRLGGGGRSHSRSGLAALVLAKRLALLTLTIGLLAVPAATAATSGGTTYTAFMTKSLTSAIKAKPGVLYNVIIKGTRGQSASTVASATTSAIQKNPSGSTKTQYSVINGVAATMSGAAIQALSKNTGIASIVQDAKVGGTSLSNVQLWPDVSQVSSFFAAAPTAPAIAVVDSGVDASRAADFGARVVAQASFVPGNTANATRTDGFGHGTLVAGIAAGQAAGYSGAAPGANIVALDVLDDSGAGSESDVISACDWIYKNKDKYNIGVVNLSLLAGTNASFMYDPLDQAVEKLWLSGVVVVTAAGNFAVNGQASGLPYAPANDPFAITVGAADINGTVGTTDDFNAPWSAYGYTLDGFAKPELGAPGRHMNGSVPTTATMYTQHPERVVAPGYMWMSGTSFAAPVVSGIAADLLALHPTWTPGQVKGALMLTAAPTSGSTGAQALGVGDVQASAAAAVVAPPNPNAGLDGFVVSDPNGGQVFDAASWSSAAQANASWSSASWSSASWSSASWSSASWSSASWSSASWSSASWSSASWSSGQTTDGSLPDASWSSLIWVG